MLAQPAVRTRAASGKTRARHGRPYKSGFPPRRTDRRRLRLQNGGDRAEPEVLLQRAGREQVHGTGDDAGPSRLVARTEPGAVVAVEVLVEQHEIAPVRILLELLDPSVDRPPALRVSEEDARQAS